jgi:hypothetical protein
VHGAPKGARADGRSNGSDPGRGGLLLDAWPTLLVGLGAVALVIWALVLAWGAFEALSSVASVLVDHMDLPMKLDRAI